MRITDLEIKARAEYLGKLANTFAQLRSELLASTATKILVTTNPPKVSWIYDEWVKGALNELEKMQNIVVKDEMRRLQVLAEVEDVRKPL